IMRARGYDTDGHRGYRVSVAQDLGSKIERGYRSSLSLAVDEDWLYDREDPRRPADWSDGGFANLEALLTSTRRFHRVRWTGALRARGSGAARVMGQPMVPLAWDDPDALDGGARGGWERARVRGHEARGVDPRRVQRGVTLEPAHPVVDPRLEEASRPGARPAG